MQNNYNYTPTHTAPSDAAVKRDIRLALQAGQRSKEHHHRVAYFAYRLAYKHEYQYTFVELAHLLNMDESQVSNLARGYRVFLSARCAEKATAELFRREFSITHLSVLADKATKYDLSAKDLVNWMCGWLENKKENLRLGYKSAPVSASDLANEIEAQYSTSERVANIGWYVNKLPHMLDGLQVLDKCPAYLRDAARGMANAIERYKNERKK